MKIPETNEILQILNATAGTKIELPVLLALCLGLRRSEICGLKWDCVDFERKRIVIKAAIVAGEDGKLFEKKPKSYAGNRIVDVPDCIMELLQSQERKDDYIVPLRGDYIYKSFSKILKANNINHIRFHDLRHTNASIMLLLNVPDNYAMKRGGWSTQHTMKNVYQHIIEKEEKIINKQINDFFDNMLAEFGKNSTDTSENNEKNT